MGGYLVHYTGRNVVLFAHVCNFEEQGTHGLLRSALTLCNHQGYAGDLAIDRLASCYSGSLVGFCICMRVRYGTRGCNRSLRQSISGIALLSWQQSEGMRVKVRNWMTSA